MKTCKTIPSYVVRKKTSICVFDPTCVWILGFLVVFVLVGRYLRSKTDHYKIYQNLPRF